MNGECRRATTADVPALLETMTSGFLDDPLYAWLYPDRDERRQGLHESFELVVSVGLARADLFTNDARSAVALWTEPGVELLDEVALAAFLHLLRTQIGDRTGEVADGMAAVARHRPSEPHFMLHNVVVRADAQSRGAGTALLEPVLARCDRDGAVAFLDSSNARNVAFYERLGFGVVAETRLPAGGPVMRSMLRRP